MKCSRKLRVGLFIASVLISLIPVLGWRPSVTAISPDGRYTARLTKPSLFQDALVTISIIDNKTERITKRAEYNVGGDYALGFVFCATEEPVGLLWSRDSQFICYIYNQYDLYHPHLHYIYGVSPEFPWAERGPGKEPPAEIVQEFSAADPPPAQWASP